MNMVWLCIVQGAMEDLRISKHSELSLSAALPTNSVEGKCFAKLPGLNGTMHMQSSGANPRESIQEQHCLYHVLVML